MNFKEFFEAVKELPEGSTVRLKPMTVEIGKSDKIVAEIFEFIYKKGIYDELTVAELIEVFQTAIWWLITGCLEPARRR